MKPESFPQSAQAAFRHFSRREIAPHAELYDQRQQIPQALIHKLAANGYFGSLLPPEWGGRGLDAVSYGVLHKEIAQSSSSVASLLTVHDMASHALLRWGNAQLKKHWLPKLARGERLAAFAVTEANAGSEARAVEATAERQANGSFLLNGRKKWITGGQIANVFLVLAKCEGLPVALLVERELQGVSTHPIAEMLGLRASMLADVVFENCAVAEDHMVGRVNFGRTIIQAALDLGRFNIAWDSLGVLEGCLDSSIDYADRRVQFGSPLSSHQLVAQMITDMVTNVEAARLLCLQAARFRNANDPQATLATLIAKYFTSRAAAHAASDAVQIHGAIGCSQEYPVQRYMRDAKIMEIIEGSSQIQQVLISRLYPRKETSEFREEIA
jgi:glutaryl-CoA dehydrogenase (non-decarboxylating)